MFFFWLYLLLASLIGLLLAKLYFQYTKGVFHSDADLTGKIIVITGGNTGIGKEYVRDVARRNATIIMACRNVQRGLDCVREISQESNNSNIFVEQCDLTSFQSVRDCCDRIIARDNVPRIDVLVAFAAALGDNLDRSRLTSEHGFEMQFQCNHLSHFLMVNRLIPLLRRSDSARVILTSSSAHLFGQMDLDNVARLEKYDRHEFFTYADSKLAMVMFAKELADRLSNETSITVNSLHPGTVYTNSIKHQHNWFVKYPLVLLSFLQGKSVQDGAQTLLYLTMSDEVQGVSGHYFTDCAKSPYNSLVDDRQLRRGLWQLSVDLVKPFLEPIDPLLQ